MPWVRNLRRYVGSGTGTGSEALMELETKRILLEIFKERQQRNAQAGSVPSYYKKQCQLDSFLWSPMQFYQYIQECADEHSDMLAERCFFCLKVALRVLCVPYIQI
ncbi:unnamed protein product [Musa acuminata subsp. burmannicoides]